MKIFLSELRLFRSKIFGGFAKMKLMQMFESSIYDSIECFFVAGCQK